MELSFASVKKNRKTLLFFFFAGLLLIGCDQTFDLDNRLSSTPRGGGTEAGNVTGMILNPHYDPLKNASVSMYSRKDGAIFRTTSNDNGEFSFTKMDAGNYLLIATDSVNLGLVYDYNYNPEMENNLSKLRLDSLGSIEGVAWTNDPLHHKKFTLHLIGTPWTIESELNGRFNFNKIPTGDYLLTVQYEGANPLNNIPIHIEPGRKTTIADTLKLNYGYVIDGNMGDTIRASFSQLPWAFQVQVDAPMALIDSVVWSANGKSIPHNKYLNADMESQYKLAPSLEMNSNMLLEGFSNKIVLKIYLQSGMVEKKWIFNLASESQQTMPYFIIDAQAIEPTNFGSINGEVYWKFKINKKKLLQGNDLQFWGLDEISFVGDTSLPNYIVLPLGGELQNLGEGGIGHQDALLRYNLHTYEQSLNSSQLKPGQQVSFVLVPDNVTRGKAMRLRSFKQVDYFQNIHLLENIKSSWYKNTSSSERVGSMMIEMNGKGVEVFHISNPQGSNLIQRYTADSLELRERIIPIDLEFMDPLLNYRILQSSQEFRFDGLESKPCLVDIYISEKGRVLNIKSNPNDNTKAIRFYVQISAEALLELKQLLLQFPQQIPIDWDLNNLAPVSSSGESEYLFSQKRGVFQIAGENSNAKKQALFLAMKDWLKRNGQIK